MQQGLCSVSATEPASLLPVCPPPPPPEEDSDDDPSSDSSGTGSYMTRPPMIIGRSLERPCKWPAALLGSFGFKV